jgi:hypothetical protein
MAVHIKIPRKKVGLLSFGKEKSFKLKFFPFVTSIKEQHLIGIGILSRPITKEHERWIKVLNEHEVYVYKQSLPLLRKGKNSYPCHICENYYGMVKFEDINQDPHLRKIFYWQP